MEPMRFTIEQLCITNGEGKPAGGPAAAVYHVVEAESAHAALDAFVAGQGAAVIGSVQVLPGFHAVATARRELFVFTVHVMPGSDGFMRTTTDRENIVRPSTPAHDGVRDDDDTQRRR